MSTQIFIEKGIKQGKEICFSLPEMKEGQLGTPSGTMITDSEKMTFVYLINEADEYGHIHFTQTTWPLMVDALKLQIDPVLVREGEKITLTGFIDELTMLIFNIEGNHNYGETFSSAVEEAFAEILQ